ncbi:Hypothetical protein CINCED_3A004344 [Cinara cedri]|uniref:Uncharacterized protein n=1 Tax=Cinara cedri TaxID=506608 RepID=A0A5E4NFN2_9HEMI|nr:Hypothetical protein CINCED_3A004344 [Cinara cedri]
MLKSVKMWTHIKSRDGETLERSTRGSLQGVNVERQIYTVQTFTDFERLCSRFAPSECLRGPVDNRSKHILNIKEDFCFGRRGGNKINPTILHRAVGEHILIPNM